MSGTVLLEGRSSSPNLDSLNYEGNSEITRYALNLRLVSSSELHQDLLFYEMQLDTILREEVKGNEIAGENESDDGARRDNSGLVQIISAKVRVLEEEINRRRKGFD
jgi:hypothetical protein